MKCYFCNEEQTEEPQTGRIRCYPCSCDFPGVTYVATMVDEKGALLYAHIYIDESTIVQIPGATWMPHVGFTMRLGHNYHIRLHLQEGFTNIGDPTDSEVNDIMKVPGYPIKPSNAKQKLKTYLLFS